MQHRSIRRSARTRMPTTSRTARVAAAGATTVLVALGMFVAAPAAFAATPSPSPSTTATPAPSVVDDTNGCAAGHLPAIIEGAPASYHPGDARGAWIWHGKDGYAIRVTHRQDGKLVEFTGSVTADRPIQVKAVQLEKSDRYWFSNDHKTLYFAFANYGHTDGIDFRADCAAKVSFGVRADGGLLSPSRVLLGAHAVAALSNPFTVERRK
jgi:hypothetical protein